MIYDNIERNENNIVEVEDQIHVSYILGPKVEIKGDSDNEYRVEFIDKKNNFIVYQSVIKPNHWTRASIQYFTDWRIRVWKGEELFYEEDYNPRDKRIYISMGSSALGDTLAWISYVEEFRKKYNCEVILSTFHNNLFEGQYPNIEFIKPGTVVHNLYAQYSIGLYYNDDDSFNHFKNPRDPKSVPMQQIATDILGLDYEEIRPNVVVPKVVKDDKLVTIAIHGTSQAKYWNNPTGWQEVVDVLRTNGYTVKLLSKEGNGYMGNKHPNGIVKHPEGSLEDVIEEMAKSKFFIGIGSGLSWLSWATGTPTVLISGFSEPWTEMKDCVRISAPLDKCSGCFNRNRLDAGDWNWCPEHKGTDRQFECTKSITGQEVIERIRKEGLI